MQHLAHKDSFALYCSIFIVVFISLAWCNFSVLECTVSTVICFTVHTHTHTHSVLLGAQQSISITNIYLSDSTAPIKRDRMKPQLEKTSHPTSSCDWLSVLMGVSKLSLMVCSQSPVFICYTLICGTLHVNNRIKHSKCLRRQTAWKCAPLLHPLPATMPTMVCIENIL